MDADTNICAVILNYNDAQTTMKLTESWKNSKVIRNIIIVDNCSTDDSWEKLGEFKEELASDHADNPDNLDKVQLHLFRTPQNGGYGSGNQAGIDYAVQYLEPDYIIIANPDVQVSDACILRVADALEKQEDGAVASAMVVDVKGQSSFSYWDLQSVWLDLLDTGLVTRRLFRAFLKTPLEKLPLAADGVSRMVGALPGSFFMVKTGCFTMVFGVMQKHLHLTGWKETVAGLACTVAALAIGMAFPLVAGKDTWSYLTFAYIFMAAVMPMWLLMQPRDYMTTFMFAGMIIGAVVGLLVAHPTMNLPVYTGFKNAKMGDMFPILFVTVACGAVSGFHSLVSSGTSSKTISNEKDMLKVGYGAMVLESLLAVLALCVAGAAAAADGTAATGTPFQIFSAGVAGFLEMFGIPVYVAQCFMTMCVSALALTSLDSVARIGRMSFQELFSVDDMEHAEGWRKLFCNKYFSTVITLACGFILTKIGYSNIWPLFGSANQLLSALVLITLCVFLKVTGRENKTLFPPLIIMLCVTFTALVERTIALVNAFGAGTAVFMVEGLQLIIAILLMVLGVIIVYTSGKELFNKKAEVKHSKEGKLA